MAPLNLVIVDASMASILEMTPTPEEEIHSAQANDESLQLDAKQTKDFSKDQHGMLRFRGRICLPDQESLKK